MKNNNCKSYCLAVSGTNSEKLKNKFIINYELLKNKRIENEKTRKMLIKLLGN